MNTASGGSKIARMMLRRVFGLVTAVDMEILFMRGVVFEQLHSGAIAVPMRGVGF